MGATTHCVALTLTTLLLLLGSLLPHSVQAGKYPGCSPDQEAAFRPYRVDFGVKPAGCDELTFETCSDECLAARQIEVEHAPNCSSSSGSRRIHTLRNTSEALLSICEKARANMTNKYIPQASPDAPECEWLEARLYTTDMTFTTCSPLGNKPCTDECLKAIEDKIATAPVCRYGSRYTLGESNKHELVKCLVSRREDLTTNKVLNTVVTVPVTSAAAVSAHATLAVMASAVAWALLLE